MLGTSLGQFAASALRRAGFQMEPGLSRSEIAALEDGFEIRFGEDHRDFLRSGVPLGSDWVEWRGDRTALTRRIDEPVNGVLAHVEPDGFWPSDWGNRPDQEDEALRLAESHVRSWPKLIPIYSHRYSIGGSPSGSPVLSASGTDVIEYGPDIASYISIEFGLEQPPLPTQRHGSNDQLVYPWLSLDDR